MNESWQRIVREALDRGLESSKGAIPGAKLRQIIARIAPSYSEEYPPAGYEGEKFRDFLGRFGSLLTVLPRKGQDILVAPSDRPELLAAEEAGRAQLREDIFEAFTRIPRESPPREPWYERSTDKVLWNTADEAVNHPEFVRIPPATLAQELEERRVFALASEIDPAVRDKLLANLQEHSALWAFSRIVKESGLAQKWHFFRFKAILGRIRNWCGSEHVDCVRTGSSRGTIRPHVLCSSIFRSFCESSSDLGHSWKN